MKSFFIVTNYAAKMERQFNFIFAALIETAVLANPLIADAMALRAPR